MDKISYSSGTLQSPSALSGSSRTDVSSKSGVSETKEEDLTKNNAASPIDLECHIQAERITKILDEAIFKTTLAICLPNLVADYKTLNDSLTRQHMDDLLFIFEQYENPMFSASLLNLEALDDIKCGDLSLKNRLNPEMGHLLYIINSYPALRPKVEDMIKEMREEYRTDKSKPPNQSLEYLLALEKFRDLMVKQMSITAAEDLEAKLMTRKLEVSNAKLKAKMAELTYLLKVEQENFQDAMNTKVQTITKLEADLQILNSDANSKLKMKILDSERQMVLATRAHTVKCNLLKEEEVDFRKAYETLLQQNMTEEKSQRARRFKVETQLLSWIQKYDLEMSEKQTELDELTSMYDEEVRQTKECQDKLDEQDKEYVPLMAEREEEYHQEMLAKMLKFQREHAARVIQSFWKQVLTNRAEKKKLKKEWIKIKAAQKAAERAAEIEEQRLAALARKAKEVSARATRMTK